MLNRSIILLCILLGCCLGSTQANQEQFDKVYKRAGQVGYAQAGAWASLCASVALGTFVTYKTVEELLEKGLAHLPFFGSQNELLARVMSGSVVAPLATLLCVKHSKLLWYFFYIIYAGEWISPMLARDALNDLHVYVQHLSTIKAVQKELHDVIKEINVATQGMDNDEQTAMIRSSQLIDPLLVMSIEEAIATNEHYVQEALANLNDFLPADDPDVQLLIALLHNKVPQPMNDLGTEGLQQSAHAVVEHLQAGSKDLGYDAQILNSLVQQLIDYWQSYTVGLAATIDAMLRRCRAVHAIEQFIVTALDRPLHLCNDAHAE